MVCSAADGPCELWHLARREARRAARLKADLLASKRPIVRREVHAAGTATKQGSDGRVGRVAVVDLQPYVLEAATICTRGCNHMYGRVGRVAVMDPCRKQGPPRFG